MRFLCIGMVVCDFILTEIPFDIMSRDNVDIKNVTITGGGDALNVATGLSRLGEHVSISGIISNDLPGNYLISYCKKNFVNTDGLIIDDTFPTATTFALVDSISERHFISENSIFNRYSAEMISDEMIRSSDVIYLGSALTFPQLDKNGIAQIFAKAKKNGKLTAMDAAIHGQTYSVELMDLLAPTFQHTDIFFPSQIELEILTNERNPYKAAGFFENSGIKILGVKLGKDGCYVTDFQTEKIIPGVKVPNVVDTTGAGDSFFSGFLCGWAHGYDPFSCAKIGNIVSAYSIQERGGATGIPSFEKIIDDFINKHFN